MSDSKINSERLFPVNSILVSQPEPQNGKSPYFDLAEKYDTKVDFRPFIEVKPVNVKDFRKQKIEILDHTALSLPVVMR